MRSINSLSLWLSFTFILSCSQNIYLGSNKVDPCMVLDSILTNKTLGKILGLDRAENTYPSIRFFDIHSKKFRKCGSLYFIKDKNIAISYFVLPSITYSINTGQYRDIVIFDFEESAQYVYVSLTASYYENQLEKEGIPLFEFEYKKVKNSIIISNVTIKQIREQPPTPQYYK